MRAREIMLGLVLLAGCDMVGPAEHMTLSAARTNLLRAADEGSAEAFCSAAGRRHFRRAVRTFSASVEAAHLQTGLMGMGAPDEAWGAVSMGVLARIVRPSDLSGSSLALAVALDMPGNTAPGFTESRAAMEHACPELVNFYRETASFARLRQEMAQSDGSDRGLQASFDAQQQRMMAASQALEARMRATGWRGPSDVVAAR